MQKVHARSHSHFHIFHTSPPYAMLKPHLIISIACTLLLLASSCSKQRGTRSVEEIAADLKIVQPDTSVYGTLRSHSADSLTLATEYDTDPIRCTYDEARARDAILGSITEGNRYALLIDPETHSARKLINLTELSGQWFYDDADQQRGFTITTAGALSSINPKDVSFRKWKFHNGHIILYYVDTESVVRDSRDYLSDTTDIQSLTDDHLDLTFRGQSLHCYRQREAIKVKFNF